MVRIGDIKKVEITGYNHEGMGVGRVDNKVIFVPGSVEGEVVLAEVTEVKKNFLRGKLQDIEMTGKERIQPRCSVFLKCGGCQLQHIDYKTQLEIKKNLVENALKRLGRFDDIIVKPIIGMDKPWQYRNKGYFQVKKIDNRIKLGFYEESTYKLADAFCRYLFSPEVTRLLGFLEEILNEYKVKVATKEKVGLKHILIRESNYNGDILIVFVVSDNFTDKKKEIAREINKNFPQVVGVCQNTNKNSKGNILGRKTYEILGENKYKDRIGPYIFNISAASFFQVNTIQTEKLYEKVLDFASLTGKETLIDAYCGIGTISLYLAKKAKKVIGIEIVEEAVKDARNNAWENGITNTEFYCDKVENLLPHMIKEGLNPDVVVVDPPRKGCDRSLLECILEGEPQKIIYVSCNPSTLARDLKILVEGGYVIQEVQPVDMFPQTKHVETVVLIEKK